MTKTYAKWIGIILLVLGIVGFLRPGKLLGLDVGTFESVVHLITGALLAYAGFMGSDAQANSWVKIISSVYLVVGVLGFVSKTFFGLVPGELGVLDNIVHIVLGVLGWYAARGYKPAMA